MKQWTINEIKQLKSLIKTKTNQQISEIMGRSQVSIKWASRLYDIKRTKPEIRKIINKSRKDFRGEKNPNWKGGIPYDSITNNSKWKNLNRKRNLYGRRVRYAIKRGLLKRVPCEICGHKNKIVSFRLSFKNPYHVIFICLSHHRQLTRHPEILETIDKEVLAVCWERSKETQSKIQQNMLLN